MLVNPATRGNTFTLPKAKNGAFEDVLEFAVQNKKDMTEREWFWHMLVPADLHPHIEFTDPTSPCQRNEVTLNGEVWHHYFGASRRADIIFPKRLLRLNHRLKVSIPPEGLESYRIYYYFVTEFGYWPRRAGRMELFTMGAGTDSPAVLSSKYFAQLVVNKSK